MTPTIPRRNARHFLAPIEAVAVAGLSVTGTNRLALTLANAIVNRGGFTVEAATANQAIKVPADGTYAIDFTLYMMDSTACDPFGDSGGDRRHQGGGGSDEPANAVCQVLPG